MKYIVKKVFLSIIGAFIMAFGLYEVHSFSGVAEGGVLGAALLLKNTLNLSPALTSFIMNGICYFIGWNILGKNFLIYSGIGAITFSISYRLLEGSQPLFNLAPYPIIAAVIGAIFIGIGAGLSVRAGGAPSGDDALAMSLSKKFAGKIEIIYLVSDLTVLILSLSYIPVKRIIFSLISVLISGRIIGIIERFKN